MPRIIEFINYYSNQSASGLIESELFFLFLFLFFTKYKILLLLRMKILFLPIQKANNKKVKKKAIPIIG